MKTWSIAFIAFFLGACTAEIVDRLPELNFTDVRPVIVDAGQVEIIDEYAPSGQIPYIDHTFHQSPLRVMHDLVAHTISAQGGGQVLRVVISDASVVDKKLPVPKGITHAFSAVPSDRYEAKVAIRFELIDPTKPGIILRKADIAVQRTTTLMNNSSPADRDRVAFALTESLAKDVQSGLYTTVQNIFGLR